MSLGDLQAFVSEQEKLSIRVESEREDSPAIREFGGYRGDMLRGKHSQEPGKNWARG